MLLVESVGVLIGLEVLDQEDEEWLKDSRQERKLYKCPKKYIPKRGILNLGEVVHG